MYIEQKGNDVTGPARIGRVTFSKSGRSLYYRGRMFQKGTQSSKANFFDAESGERYWISGCKKDGTDRLYSGTVEIDEDAREEYWTNIRNEPEKKDLAVIRVSGKYNL